MILQTTGITKSFGDNNVLKGISLQVESGSALGILGRNGAGKTTLIRIIMGVFPQDSGEVLIDGKTINRNDLKIGYLPEERGLYAKKIILDQLIYFAQLKGMNISDAKKSAMHWLERLEMQQYVKRRLDTLSKGNQQKIQLVATLISNPDIIILDEPFSGLDPVNAFLLKDVVKEQISAGKIVLFSSHQMNYIEEFCDDIAILNSGNIVLGGSLKSIKRSYDRSRIIISTIEADKLKAFTDNELKDIVLSTQIDDNILDVKMSSESEKTQFLEKLSAKKFDIDEIKVYEPTLNEIFMEYTK